MATLDSLPPDQRAVLQLILQRGRSYDQIATLLSIDRAAVRERALGAVTALGPQTGVSEQSRASIADYLLAQLSPELAQQTRDRLGESPSERAWARVVASELAPLASGPLPEIPSGPAEGPPAPVPSAAPEPPAPSAAPEPPAPVPPAPEPAAQASPAPEPAAPLAPAPPPAAPTAPPTAPAYGPPAPEPAGQAGDGRRAKRERRSVLRRRSKPPGPAGPAVAAASQGDGARSSRMGGILLIAVTVLVVAIVAIVLLRSGGSDNNSSTHGATTAASQSAASSTTAGSTTAGSTTAGSTTAGGSSTSAKVIAQINLTPPASGSKAAGIAEVLREGATNGIAIVAQNVPPNSTKPPNAYAVWLYNSPTDAHILGFVNPGVGSNGRLSTAGGLPTNAAHYKQLIVTLETKASPKQPGAIILQGALTGV